MVRCALTTYNEKDSIKDCINKFSETGYVDEIIIVDNNAVQGTIEEVQTAEAILIHEPRQGYGYGFQKGLDAAQGDFLVMCEPDGTFTPSDIEKLLSYTDSMEVVQGTRTSTTTILDKANMGYFLKYGNYFVAKLAEVAFIGTSPWLSDCGCTLRILSRSAYNRIRPYFREGGSAFGFEMLLLALRARLPLCQIPVHYGERVGVSSVTGNFIKTFMLGVYMIWLVFKHFFENIYKPIKPE